VEPARLIEAHVVASGDVAHLEAERSFIERLARVDRLTFAPDATGIDTAAFTGPAWCWNRLGGPDALTMPNPDCPGPGFGPRHGTWCR